MCNSIKAVGTLRRKYRTTLRSTSQTRYTLSIIHIRDRHPLLMSCRMSPYRLYTHQPSPSYWRLSSPLRRPCLLSRYAVVPLLAHPPPLPILKTKFPFSGMSYHPDRLTVFPPTPSNRGHRSFTNMRLISVLGASAGDQTRPCKHPTNSSSTDACTWCLLHLRQLRTACLYCCYCVSCLVNGYARAAAIRPPRLTVAPLWFPWLTLSAFLATAAFRSTVLATRSLYCHPRTSSSVSPAQPAPSSFDVRMPART